MLVNLDEFLQRRRVAQGNAAHQGQVPIIVASGGLRWPGLVESIILGLTLRTFHPLNQVR